MNGDQLKTIATGLVGSATSIGAAVYSMLPHLEAWMRLASGRWALRWALPPSSKSFAICISNAEI